MLWLITNPTMYWGGYYHILARLDAHLELSYHFGQYVIFSAGSVSPVYPFLEY